jgi:hypothetical protein
MVFLPGIVGGIVRRRPGYRECWWSMAVGLSVMILLTPMMPREAFAPALFASILVYLLVAWFSRKANKAAEGATDQMS